MKTLIDRDHFEARLVKCLQELPTDLLYTAEERQMITMIYESVLFKLRQEPVIEASTSSPN